MGYPGVSLNAAKSIDEARRSLQSDAESPQAPTVWKSGTDFDEARATECLQQCCDIAEHMNATGASHAEFDSRCAPVVHRTLGLSARVAGDADFWRWLTFTQGHWGAEIVDWRYGGQRRTPVSSPTRSQIARPVYYGLGLMKKGMFAKLWLCADRMYVPDRADDLDRYDGIDYTDVDFWDSHIIDVDYDAVPAMARAFVTIVRNLSIPRGDRSSSDAPVGYRDLAKELRRRQATVVFELFDQAEAIRYVQDVWNERDSWYSR